MTQTPDTTLPALPVVESATAIAPRDFHSPGRRYTLDLWTPGTLRYVIDALAGTPVAIVIDTDTGYTLVGARLIRASSSGPGVGSGPGLLVETNYGSGTHRVWHRMAEIGVIIPLADSDGTKWAALKAYSRDMRTAVQAAQRDHGPAEGRCSGRWYSHPSDSHPGHVCVEYEPYTDDRAGSRWYGYVDVATSETATAPV